MYECNVPQRSSSSAATVASDLRERERERRERRERDREKGRESAWERVCMCVRQWQIQRRDTHIKGNCNRMTMISSNYDKYKKYQKFILSVSHPVDMTRRRQDEADTSMKHHDPSLDIVNRKLPVWEWVWVCGIVLVHVCVSACVWPYIFLSKILLILHKYQYSSKIKRVLDKYIDLRKHSDDNNKQ